jgi:hypothetical protein
MKSTEIKKSLIAIKKNKIAELILTLIFALTTVIIIKYPNLLLGGYDANGNQTNYITFLYLIYFFIIIGFLYLRLSLISNIDDIEKNIE